MRRALSSPRVRVAAVLGAAAALAAGATALPSGAHPVAAASGGTTTLTAEVAHDLVAHAVLGRVAGDRPMRVAVALSYDAAARDAAYSAMYTPGSASYHRFLTPAEFRTRFGADHATAERVLRAVTADGLQVAYAAPDGSYLELTGSTAQVERTFAVTENRYAGLRGQTFTANAQAPTVPVGVAAVLGLTSLTTYTTALSQQPTAPTRVSAPAQDTCGEVPTMCLGSTTPADLWGIYDQPNAAAYESKAYTADEIAASTSDFGQGQKVAIFGEGQLDEVVKDLRVFEKNNKLPVVPVRRVLVGDNLQDNAGATEWELDSDASTGMSPDLAEEDFYFGSDLSDASIGGTYSAWVNDAAGPTTGNSSFGGPEVQEYLGGFILDAILQQAAMEGRTMFSSAGDGGGSCLPGANGVTNDAVPCVEYPSASPYVTGVGGTVLYSAATAGTQTLPATRALEYSWTYSGGGVSDFLPAPPWQVKAQPATLQIPCAAGQHMGETCRTVPDVSAQSGDVATNGYQIVGMADAESFNEGGTSLSSPLWAGMWARVAAAHPSTCATAAANPHYTAKLGFAQQDLYALGNDTAQDSKDFFDVGGAAMSQPTGNGQQVALPRTPGVDPTGYDAVSGLGTPDVTNIAKALDCGSTAPVATNAATATDTTTTPDSTFVYDSPAGCPTNGTVTDPAGDEIPADASLDITKLHVTNTASAVTFTTTLSSPATSGDYAFEFKYGSGAYAVTTDVSPSGTTTSLYAVPVTVTPIGLGVITTPTDLSDALTGSATGSTVSATMPLSVFNTTAKPTTLLKLGSKLAAITEYTNVGVANTALDLDYDNEPVDQAEFFQCQYTLAANAATAPGGAAGGTGSTGSSGSSGGTSGSASGSGSAAGSGSTSGSTELAFTGLTTLVPVTALVLVGGGLGGVVLRRRRRGDL